MSNGGGERNYATCCLAAPGIPRCDAMSSQGGRSQTATCAALHHRALLSALRAALLPFRGRPRARTGKAWPSSGSRLPHADSFDSANTLCLERAALRHSSPRNTQAH
eukprot:5709162-Prymnesium_polylepis.1